MRSSGAILSRQICPFKGVDRVIWRSIKRPFFKPFAVAIAQVEIADRRIGQDQSSSGELLFSDYMQGIEVNELPCERDPTTKNVMSGMFFCELKPDEHSHRRLAVSRL
jgi:hypothetical protein